MTFAILDLPPEIFLQILDYLKDEDSFAAALGFRSLSLSCHALHNFIDAYVSKSEHSVLDIEGVAEKWQVPSGLNVYCRWMARICFLCQNRNRDDDREVFTGMFLCQACEAFHCPKISKDVFEQRYAFYSSDDIPKLEWRERSARLVCKIDDVRKLYDENVIKVIHPDYCSDRQLLEEGSFFQGISVDTYPPDIGLKMRAFVT
jgi:hypothetical protein